MKTFVFVMVICVANTGALRATTVRAEDPMQRGQDTAPDQRRFDHSHWDAVLTQHVDDHGRVNYSGIRDSRLFREYLANLEATPADQLIDDRDRLAFWINAYNALTIQAVLATLPADRSQWPDYRITEQKAKGKSIWKGMPFNVGGGRWTLDEIEHSILRKQDGLRDPRIHVALVCAARGCPPLWNRAYTGDQIDDQLVATMNRFVSNPRQCLIDLKRRSIRISKVFEWYGADFVDGKFMPHAASIPEFLASYVTDNAVAQALLASRWKVTYFDYDWKLNTQR